MARPTTLNDWAKFIDSPPLQGRGRGWGVSARKAEELKRHATAMRNNPTEAERRLWSILSRSQLEGFKFRRQAQIGNAIADFLCPQKGLIVEVDGDTHTDPAADARRTSRLEAMGYLVVRVTNEDAMSNLEGVRRMLLEKLLALPDRRTPHPNPSPEGEGLKEVEAQKLLGDFARGERGVIMAGKRSDMYDYPLSETQIIWNPDDDPKLPPVDVVKLGFEDDDRYSSSWGACNQDFCEASPAEQVNMLMRQFVHMAAIDHVEPEAIHKAFMQIPGYRCALAQHGSIDPESI